MKSGTIKKYNGLSIKFGNSKLPASTIIFNMGSSKNCPSRKLGLCKVAHLCYARKPEKLYPACLPYREQQSQYWADTDIKKIKKDFSHIIDHTKKKPTVFRYNESGDFYSQLCIEKLSQLAEYLLKEHNIITYGYSARSDLDFTNASFFCKGSDNDAGNHGKTIVIKTVTDCPVNFEVCPGDCNTCSLCYHPESYNIAFPKH